MSTRKLLLASAVSVLMFSAAARDALAAGPQRIAPLNPAFVRFQQMAQTRAYGEHGRGFVPSPVNLGHLAHQKPNLGYHVQRAAARFDLRDEGRLTAARNQGSCGACWAFATLGSLESSLMPTEVFDFSENNLKNNSGYALDACAGGNVLMAAGYMNRWSGPVLEVDDPYQEFPGVSPTLPPVKHLEEILLVGSRAGPGTMVDEVIKTTLTTYKTGLTAAMKMDEGYYDSTNHTYLYRGASTDTDHLVVIVGWDDNFDKDRFNPPASANGAFIVRNSWGPDWGEGGYFYVSYEDPLLGSSDSLAVLLQPAPTSNFHRNHLHAPLGLTQPIGMGADTTTGWFAVAFTNDAEEVELLEAIGLYTLAANATYEIWVYTDVGQLDPRSGTLVTPTSITGTVPYAGYHTIRLGAAGVRVPGKKRFSVVVKIRTPDYATPIPLEAPIAGYAAPTADYGESYISDDGANWADLVLLAADASVALNVFGDPTCDDENDCTADSGDAFAGTCAHVPLDGADCDDHQACTEQDTCDQGVCKGTDKVCPPAALACHEANACNPATGDCEQPVVADGTACDDGDPCTEGDHCVSGADKPNGAVCEGLALLCKVEECWVGRCEVSAGGCVKEKAPDGTACGEGTCRDGACQRADALRSYACGSTGAPASLLILGLVALALGRRRASAHR